MLLSWREGAMNDEEELILGFAFDGCTISVVDPPGTLWTTGSVS